MSAGGRRENTGGKREGAGRKKRIEEVVLIEMMDSILVPKEMWDAVSKKVVEGDAAAQKLWANYRFGMPKQIVENKNEHTFNGFSIADLYGDKEAQNDLE
jgi:hypothetical protein